MRYYVVWKGHSRGVFDNWDTCSKSIKGYPGATYKSFKTLQEAEEAFQRESLLYIGKTPEESQRLKDEDIRIVIGEPVNNSISVGGYYDFLGNKMKYRGVDPHTNKLLFDNTGIKGGNYLLARFLPIVHALAHLHKQSIDAPVYTTNTQVVCYVRNGWYNKLYDELDPKLEASNLLERAINWLSKHDVKEKVLLWDKQLWGDMPGTYKRKHTKRSF